MADIFPFIPSQRSFDAEALHIMGEAFDKARRQQPSVTPERIASAIVSLAHDGQDADVLCAAALSALAKQKMDLSAA